MQYRDCGPVVSHDEDDAEPIRITFNGGSTMHLSEVDASWLADDIQRELREMHRQKLAKAVPLTCEMRRTLRVGDRVVVRMDHGHPIGDDIYTVKREPWRLGHGAWVIGLEGISGGYDLSRIVGILSTAYSRIETAEVRIETRTEGE